MTKKQKLPILPLFLTLMTLLNVVLLWQNLQLKGVIGNAVEHREIAPGDDLSRLADRSGFAPSSRVTSRVIYYFSPYCVFCERLSPTLKDVVDRIDTSRVELIGLVPEGIAEPAVRSYLHEAGLVSLRVMRVSEDDAAALGFIATPTFTVVASDWTVRRTWTGLWDTEAHEAIVEELGVPNLTKER